MNAGYSGSIGGERLVGIALIGMLVMGTACAEPAPPPASGQERATGALEAGKPDSALATVPVKDPTPTARLDEVDWVEAGEHEQIPAASLSEKQREVVGLASVPLLLPKDAAYVEAAILTAGETWAAASMSIEGHTVVIQGTRQSFEVPGLTDQQKEPVMINPHGHELTRTKGIVGLSFKAFGVAYMLDIECSRPMEDTRCTEDAFILELAESLAVVEGGRDE